MKYTIEKRTSRQEWYEVNIPAAEFLINADKLKSQYEPTLLFERGIIEVDELWGVGKNGQVWTSSFLSGVMGWDEQKQSYILYRHFTETDLGQFISAVLKLDDELERILGVSRTAYPEAETDKSTITQADREAAVTELQAENERLRVALEIIARGAARSHDTFKEKLGGRSYPTWFAVNELQMGLDSITGTARAALAQKEPGE